MKKKILLLILIIFWVLALMGCDGGVITDESKVRNVIQEYFSAINNQDWDNAKDYCIYESDIYYETCDLEGHIDDLIFQYETVDFAFEIDIFDISINNINYAQAYIDGTLNISYDSTSDNSDGSGYMYLEKIGNDWKIYDFK